MRGVNMETNEIWIRPTDDSLAALSGIGSQDSLDCNGIALCGSRGAGELGIGMAEAVGQLSADVGLPLVSGYAKGVDMAGHAACVAAGGHTIAVLAEGLSDKFKPRRELLAAVDPWDDIRDHLTVVSQFESNARWTVWRAMQRNATICELGHVLVAIDPGEKGGTLDAIKKAVKRQMPVVIAWSNPDLSLQHLDPLASQERVTIVHSEDALIAAVHEALNCQELASDPEQLALRL